MDKKYEIKNLKFKTYEPIAVPTPAFSHPSVGGELKSLRSPPLEGYAKRGVGRDR